MKILLVNPPNSGRSIPEERYGLDTYRKIFRGEPLALETLAGNLFDHEVRIVDLKPDPDGLIQALDEMRPDFVGITGVTCEANSVLRIARQVKERFDIPVAVGGIHASSDPDFFNQENVDYVIKGLGKASFRELVEAVQNGEMSPVIPGVAKTNPGGPFQITPRNYSKVDLVEERAPRYDLVAGYRERDCYIMTPLPHRIGFVATSFGCPYNCTFCCIKGLTGGRYIAHDESTVLRDIQLLGDIVLVRLIDANAFGDVERSKRLVGGIETAGLQKQFIADVRSDTVVKHPELIRRWKEAGLRAVVIGFEEICDEHLAKLNKANAEAVNAEAIRILHDIGITIVGDFIVSPEYDEAQFEALGRYLSDHAIDLPMLAVLTPLPGTALYESMKDRIVIRDLDYYTLTNAVIPTRLPERVFYERYADLIKSTHAKARL